MEVVMLSDEALAAVVPIAVYWIYSGIHMALGQSVLMQKYRLHPKDHEDTKNMASKRDVLKNVLVQQLMQLVSVLVLTTVTGGGEVTRATGGTPAPTSYLTAARQITVAVVVFDGYRYFWHRLAHRSRFLYRHLHSWHHRIVVPYAFGAIYGHPVEALVADTAGGSLAFLASGISPRASAVFFSLCTVKAIDNHCSLCLLPFRLQSLWNGAAYHDVHHQPAGVRHNFSDLFFVTWDKVFGTHMPYVVKERPGGGLMLQLVRPGAKASEDDTKSIK